MPIDPFVILRNSDFIEKAVEVVLSRKYASIIFHASRAVLGELDITIYNMLRDRVI